MGQAEDQEVILQVGTQTISYTWNPISHISMQFMSKRFYSSLLNKEVKLVPALQPH